MKRLNNSRFMILLSAVCLILGVSLAGGLSAAADLTPVPPPVFGTVGLFPGARLELTVVDAADLAGINLPPAPCYVNLAFIDGNGRTVTSQGPITLMPGAPVSTSVGYDQAVTAQTALRQARPTIRPEVRPVIQPLTWSDSACNYLVASVQLYDETNALAAFSHAAAVYGRGQNQQEAPAFGLLTLGAGQVVRLSAVHAGDVLDGDAAAEPCSVTLSFLGADGRAIGAPMSYKLSSGVAGINVVAIGPEAPSPFFVRPVVTFTDGGDGGCASVVASAEVYPGPNGPTELLSHPARLVWSNGQVPGEG